MCRYCPDILEAVVVAMAVRCAAYAVDFVKMSKIPNSYASDAFLELKMH